ncbi:Gypsy retrotransposon integrase-like protein 1 [Argiope bruennichi]|uniref:Gypsy retrotransposon integrase-like protein 1 n=1 Tax=Argiope bruennichi TaxID=94029 RepID=A0A8T0EDG8_ARGBR|nr:Gypsy retrotransposon integrase-like protein 1 [Argiope bruennichi]
MTSKYPDAIPVEDISSISVTDALLEIFSRMGFPRKAQYDLGTSFTNQLTTEFFERFGIKVTHSSVYHPQSNPVERFHRTLKKLLKVLCLESGNDWERNLPATFLALRMVMHESTGFSPAELMHGRNLRTPEVLLYEQWMKPQETNSSLIEYIFDLINGMKRCQKLAVERMTEVQAKRTTWYHKNAVRRKFRVGDQVLVLATSQPNKMAVRWTGPGVIESQHSDTNYIVKMANKRDGTQTSLKDRYEVIVGRTKNRERARRGRIKAERQHEREFELEPLRISNSSEINSSLSSRNENSRPRRDIKHLIPKFDSNQTDMSIYLTLLERQLKTAEMDEAEWVSQPTVIMPLDWLTSERKKPEDKAQDYEHIKQVLLERFKIKTETYRQRFVSHQKKPNALWKELILIWNIS